VQDGSQPTGGVGTNWRAAPPSDRTPQRPGAPGQQRWGEGATDNWRAKEHQQQHYQQQQQQLSGEWRGPAQPPLTSDALPVNGEQNFTGSKAEWRNDRWGDAARETRTDNWRAPAASRSSYQPHHHLQQQQQQQQQQQPQQYIINNPAAIPNLNLQMNPASEHVMPIPFSAGLGRGRGTLLAGALPVPAAAGSGNNGPGGPTATNFFRSFSNGPTQTMSQWGAHSKATHKYDREEMTRIYRGLLYANRLQLPAGVERDDNLLFLAKGDFNDVLQQLDGVTDAEAAKAYMEHFSLHGTRRGGHAAAIGAAGPPVLGGVGSLSPGGNVGALGAFSGGMVRPFSGGSSGQHSIDSSTGMILDQQNSLQQPYSALTVPSSQPPMPPQLAGHHLIPGGALMAPTGSMGMGGVSTVPAVMPPAVNQFVYKDPQGQLQGPFSKDDIIEWYEGGFFPLDLQVRAVEDGPGAPFNNLSDMLRRWGAKVAAVQPPGFLPGGAQPQQQQQQNMINAANAMSGLSLVGAMQASSGSVTTAMSLLQNMQQQQQHHHQQQQHQPSSSLVESDPLIDPVLVKRSSASSLLLQQQQQQQQLELQHQQHVIMNAGQGSLMAPPPQQQHQQQHLPLAIEDPVLQTFGSKPQQQPQQQATAGWTAAPPPQPIVPPPSVPAPSLAEIQKEEEERARHQEHDAYASGAPPPPPPPILGKPQSAMAASTIFEQEAARPETKPAPWIAAAPIPAAKKSLLDIQREEEERAAKAAKLAVATAAASAVSGGGWAQVARGNMSSGNVSLRDIIKEEEEHATAGAPAEEDGLFWDYEDDGGDGGNGSGVVPPPPPPPPRAAAAAARPSAPLSSGGAWAAAAGQAPKIAAVMKPPPAAAAIAPPSAVHAPSVAPRPPPPPPPPPARRPVVPGIPVEHDVGPTSANGEGSGVLSGPFKEWCSEQMKSLQGTEDVALCEFLMSLESNSEAAEYVTLYLGSSPQVSAFCTEFLKRKLEFLAGANKKVRKKKGTSSSAATGGASSSSVASSSASVTLNEGPGSDWEQVGKLTAPASKKKVVGKQSQGVGYTTGFELLNR